MLPKLNTALFSLTLPSNGTVIKFRPFVVGEEKILLGAIDGSPKEIMDTLMTVIDACTSDEVDVEKLPLIDLEFIFLNLRIQAKGEIATFGYNCPECDTFHEMSVDLNTIVPTASTVSNIIKLTDTVGIELAYPSTNLMSVIDDQEMTLDTIFKIINKSIVSIYDGDQVFASADIDEKELVEFVDSLSRKQFENVKKFFDEAPKLSHEMDITCKKCDHKKHIVLEGISTFLELD